MSDKKDELIIKHTVKVLDNDKNELARGETERLRQKKAQKEQAVKIARNKKAAEQTDTDDDISKRIIKAAKAVKRIFRKDE